MFTKVWNGRRFTFRWVPEEDEAAAQAEGLFPDEARVLTDRGLRAVGALCPGDLLWCRGRRYLPLKALERRVLQPELLGDPRLWPVRIAAGALGPDVPSAALLVLPDQRLVLSGRRQEGARPQEALVPAVALVTGRGVTQRQPERPVATTRLVLDDGAALLVENLLCASARRRILFGCEPLFRGRPSAERQGVPGP
ncbi:Hint domain-containing protein [Cereibacter sediminicola]|uniref:Hint domain-containing protein n=1 Tax=Cereibacter sediminicola TaxID=2584941 RepID=UPI00119EC453|nr:Hint domain-containing protein [Cereibacter sediminicola]